MGVIEGHAEHVMDVVGAEALPSLDELRTALDRRRQERSPLLAIIERLIGLEAKLRQYEDGKRFCDAVASARGRGGPAPRVRRPRAAADGGRAAGPGGVDAPHGLLARRSGLSRRRRVRPRRDRALSRCALRAAWLTGP